MSWAPVLGRLVAGEDLDRDDAAWAMRQILGGEATPAQLAAFAVALRAKGETIAELSALADTMLEFATPIEISDHAVDIRVRRIREAAAVRSDDALRGQLADAGRDGDGRRPKLEARALRRPGAASRPAEEEEQLELLHR